MTPITTCSPFFHEPVSILYSKENKIGLQGLNHNDSAEKAKKLMVAAQQFLTSQAIAPTPLNYTVAYELASSRNKPLNDAIIELQKKKQKLDNYILRDLYQTYIVDTEAAVSIFTDPMDHILIDMLQSIASSGRNTNDFMNVLQENQEKIRCADSREEILSLAQGITDATEAAASEQSKLKAQLENAQREAAQLKSSIDQIAEEAIRDELTGLLNRKGMKKRITELLDGEDTEIISVIMMDIDHFKQVNDTYGHLLGDRVINGAGLEINNNIRGRDIAARYGGEEFVLILPGTDQRGAVIVAENIRQAVNKLRWENKRTGEHLPPITLSAGVAQSSNTAEIDELILRADEALYEAKRAGRDRIESAKPGQN